MASFKGQAAYSVDGKGRVAIPAKMRAALTPTAKNTFTMTRGFERCVFLYPYDTWEKMEADMSELNVFSKDTRKFLRTILMWADEAVLDKQGRISLTKPLLEFAGIGDTALIIGALDHIEIWDPESFERYVASQDEEYETLAERVMGS